MTNLYLWKYTYMYMYSSNMIDEVKEKIYKNTWWKFAPDLLLFNVLMIDMITGCPLLSKLDKNKSICSPVQNRFWLFGKCVYFGRTGVDVGDRLLALR